MFIESLMEAVKVCEAWSQISWWYRQARGLQDPPTTVALDKVIVERVELYMCRLPEGLRVSLLVLQAYIEDGIPTEAEVAESVRGLKGGSVGVPSVTRIEYFKV